MRRASQMLSSAGTSIAAKPMANRATWAHRRVGQDVAAASASYHMTSVIRVTAPLTSPSAMKSGDPIPPISDPAAPRKIARHDRARVRVGPPPSPACDGDRAASSEGVTLRGRGRWYGALAPGVGLFLAAL